MNDVEKYEFDRLGYLVIKGMLTPAQVATLLEASDELERHARAHVHLPPRRQTPWGTDVHANNERHYHVSGECTEGNALLVEDFWNASLAFDLLLDHPRTLEYINQIILGRYTINNSELRIRYPGNATFAHMGGPVGHKHRYAFTGGRIDCMMARMIYFIHDVGPDQGPFCVVPASHKSNYLSPYGNRLDEEKGLSSSDSDEEPGMVGLPVQAGDAILFTENLRHGGFANRSTQTRKTLHVGYGPYWLMSQNHTTPDEPPYLSEVTRARLTTAQHNLFRVWPIEAR